MTEERIDIEIVDKIAPSVVQKIKAIAEAARTADSSIERLKAQLSAIDTSSLDKLSAAASRAVSNQSKLASAQARLNSSNARLELSTAKASIAQQKLATESARTAAIEAKAASDAVLAQTRQESALLRLSKAKELAASKQARLNKEMIIGSGASYQATRNTAQLQYRVQNLGFQIQDIGVSLASGQNPFTVLVQQGSQILGIYSLAGTGLRAFAADLRRIAGVVAPFAAALGLVAGSFGLIQREINKTATTKVTLFDTIKGSAIAAYKAIADGAPNVLTAWNFTLDALTKGLKFLLNTALAGFEGIWLGAKLAAQNVGAAFIVGMEVIYNTIRSWLDKGKELFTQFAVGVAGLLSKIPGFTNVSLDEIASEAVSSRKELDKATTSAGKFGEALDKINSAGFKEIKDNYNKDYAGSAFKSIQTEAEKVAKAREKAAGKGGGGRKTTFSDIVRDMENEIDALNRTGQARVALMAITEAEKKLKRSLTPIEQERIVVLARELEIAKIRADVWDSNTKSLYDYNNTQLAANKLLKEGLITQEQYNTALAKTQLLQDLRNVQKTLPGYAGGVAVDEAQIQANSDIALIQQAVRNEEERARLIKAVRQRLANELRDIEYKQYNDMLITASTAFGQMAEFAKNYAGEQTGIYRTLFGASKAFAIAEGIIKLNQAALNAMADLPYPANLAAYGQVLAAGGNLIAAIQGANYRDGGFIRGAGGPRDDRVPIMASNGEFMVNAAATARHRPLLEAINDNRPLRMGSNGNLGSSTYNTRGGTMTNNINISIVGGTDNSAGKNQELASTIAATIDAQLQQSMVKFTQRQQKVGGMLSGGTVVA